MLRHIDTTERLAPNYANQHHPRRIPACTKLRQDLRILAIWGVNPKGLPQEEGVHNSNYVETFFRLIVVNFKMFIVGKYAMFNKLSHRIV